jgi:hypothetical protein
MDNVHLAMLINVIIVVLLIVAVLVKKVIT